MNDAHTKALSNFSKTAKAEEDLRSQIPFHSVN